MAHRDSRYRLTLGCAAITCALAPAYNIRWHIGFYPTTLLEIGILATAAVFVLETIRQGDRLEWRTSFTLPALLFLVAGMISVAIAPDRRSALGIYRAYVVEPIAFFFMVSAVVTTVRRASIIMAGLAVAGLIVAIPNIVVVVDFLVHYSGRPGVVRPVAIFTTPNAVPLFLVPLVAVAASLALYGEDALERAVWAVFVGVAVLASLLSLSLGGILALAAVTAGIALTHRFRVWLLAAMLAGAFALSRYPPIANRIAFQGPTYPLNSVTARFRLWGVTLRMLSHHPIFGSGIAGFQTAIQPFTAGVPEDFIYPHNIVLNFWTETGLLGLAAFTWLLVQAARLAWSGWRAAPSPWRPFHLGVLLAMVAVVVHGLVDVPYWKNDLALEFWALLALTWAGTRWARTPG